MSSTTQAFNTMMKNFLEELHQTFPEEHKIAIVIESFEDITRINARKPMELFTAALAPHAELIMAKNPALFDQPINLPGGLDMSVLWKVPDVTQATREAIWQYIQMLFMLGTTVQNLPAPLLETIESVAMSCASQMQADGNGMPDFASLSSMLMGGLGNMMGGAGGGSADLGSLAALAGMGGMGDLANFGNLANLAGLGNGNGQAGNLLLGPAGRPARRNKPSKSSKRHP